MNGRRRWRLAPCQVHERLCSKSEAEDECGVCANVRDWIFDNNDPVNNRSAQSGDTPKKTYAGWTKRWIAGREQAKLRKKSTDKHFKKTNSPNTIHFAGKAQRLRDIEYAKQSLAEKN